MMALTCAILSLRVKYQCPEAALVKLEISPAIHTKGKLHSSISATVLFNSVTVSTVEEALPVANRTDGEGFFCIFTRDKQT